MKGHRVCILYGSEEQTEGCVKDTKEGQMCCVLLFWHVCVFVYLCMNVCVHLMVLKALEILKHLTLCFYWSVIHKENYC